MELDELRTTAVLACLELTEEEHQRLSKAVTQMLEYVSKMQEVDISNLPPTTHAMVRDNRTRADQESLYPDTDALMENAPETEDRFIVIPNIL